jgi:glucose/arabinose dehydrogenase
MKRLAIASTLLAFILSPCAAPPGNALDGIERGPYFTATIKSGFPAANNFAMKGVVVSLGANRDVHVCYDTDLMRVSVAWAGDYLKFGKSQVEIVHPQPPEVAGKPLFGTATGPGWAKDGKFEDPRVNKQGRLPTDWAKYRGLYLNGWNVVLKYTVGGAEVLEMPGLETAGAASIVTRTFELDSKAAQTLLVCDGVPADGSASGDRLKVDLPAVPNEAPQALAIAVQGAKGVTLESAEGRVIAKVPAGKQSFRIAIWRGAKTDLDAVAVVMKSGTKLPSLAALTKGASGRWTQPVETQTVPGTNDGPYVVDDFAPPVPNPWNSKTFFSGFDFLPDGRAAVSCFHGDVWIVSGLDSKDGKLKWKRFATGMFQPLGLKVVDGQIFVTCRDQLTRLHDLNGDGEADFYECFNNDTVVTPNYHEFCLDLQTDTAGNFYYGKGAPWPPTVQSPHQGTMIKIAKDGSKMEVIATGLRAPNGSGLGPNGWLTVSDNEGHYMPASKLNLIRTGGFYGMRQSAHGKAPPEEKLNDYDQPICWLPKSQDNSSGGQAWVTSKQWGPFENHLLFTSYGMGTLFHVMTEEVDGQVQAGMTPFPLKFPSGTMRGRFNPKDGQLYLTGLRGWQTRGTRDGAFSRVRYTGKPVDMPHSLHATKTGLQITFTRALDTATAADAANWAVERWNYIYSGGYGSKEYIDTATKKEGHEKLEVKSVTVAPDKKTVFLEIPDMKPVMQMRVKFNLKAADGAPVSQEIFNTVHKLATK